MDVGNLRDFLLLILLFGNYVGLCGAISEESFKFILVVVLLDVVSFCLFWFGLI